MCFHFDNVDLALTHLVKNGWRDLYNGYWESKDKTCLAIVVALSWGDVVQVRAWEKDTA